MWNIVYAVVTPLRKAMHWVLWATYSHFRDAWGDTWLTRGKYGTYVAVRGSYGATITEVYDDAFCHVKSEPSTVVSPNVAVTRIPSLVLRNTWHYMIIRYSYGELPVNLSYIAHTRRLYAKVWPRHYSHKLMTSLIMLVRVTTESDFTIKMEVTK